MRIYRDSPAKFTKICQNVVGETDKDEENTSKPPGQKKIFYTFSH